MWFSHVDSRVAFQCRSTSPPEFVSFLIGKFCKSLHGIKRGEGSEPSSEITSNAWQKH